MGSPQSAAFLLHNEPLADVVRVHVSSTPNPNPNPNPCPNPNPDPNPNQVHVDMDTAGQVVQHLKLPQFVQVRARVSE